MLGGIVSCTRKRVNTTGDSRICVERAKSRQSVKLRKRWLAGNLFAHMMACCCFCNDFFNCAQCPRGSKTHIPPLFNVHTPTCPPLPLGAVSKRKPVVFLPFVFASHITQFTRKYGLSCPFSMPGPQTNLPLALIWKMSLLSQGNRIILNNGNRGKSHQLWEKGHSYIWGRPFGWGGTYTGISRARLIQLSASCHANRAQGSSMEMR